MKLSVIIPVHNGSADLARALDALHASTRTPDEIIIVDDVSSDDSAEVARSLGAEVLEQKTGPHGPAVARNRGAEIAKGDVLIFVDADVAVHPDTIALMESYLTQNPVAALFGSYDDAPSWRNLVALYKNLMHHFVHQHSQREATTFWAGCGAIRRDVFLELGGFNENYRRPSVEDIELGLRLRRRGYSIHLCPEVQVKHLKHWSLASLLRTDIFDRAIPWTQLILSSAHLPSGLNLDTKSRLSALAAWLSLVFLALSFWFVWLAIGAAVTGFVLLVLNYDFYLFFVQRGGLRFAVGAFGLHVLYLLYSSLVFLVLCAWFFFMRVVTRDRGYRFAAVRAGKAEHVG